MHDSAVFNSSNLHVPMEGGGGRNGWLLGDRGYSIQPYLMTPLRPESVTTFSQSTYQKAHTKTRNTIERAFGLWKTRFHCLDWYGGARINMNNFDVLKIKTSHKKLNKTITNTLAQRVFFNLKTQHTTRKLKIPIVPTVF